MSIDASMVLPSTHDYGGGPEETHNYGGAGGHPERREQQRREQHRREEDHPKTAEPCDPETCLLHPIIERGVETTQRAIDSLIKVGEGRERDVKWMLRLGSGFIGLTLTLLMAGSGAFYKITTRYMDEMKQRDATRLVLMQDIAALSKLAAVQAQRLEGVERSVVDLTAQFRAAHQFK